tara:strand:+ start:2796 stop:2990 length:195 start_codon:yes stop_codon:yes gene_type:complete
MNKENTWRDLPATKKQIKFLTAMAIDTFSNMSRGQASQMIEDWLEMRNDEDISSFDKETLEDYK